MQGLTPHTVTLTIYNSDATEFGVCWQTEKQGSPILQYTDELDEAFDHPTCVAADFSESTGTVKNCAVIRDIPPGEKCRFRVGDASGEFSDSSVFRAPVQDSRKISFLVLTDTQDGIHNGDWLRFAWEDALVRFPDVSFLLHCGDIVQIGGDSDMWRMMADKNAGLFRTLPTAPVAGNHDYWPGLLSGYKSVLNNHFHRALMPQDTSHGIYYSFDLGPVHFTVLSSGDSVETGSRGLLPSQLSWVENDIRSTDKRWKIVAIHNPLYSPGKYGFRIPQCSVAVALREQLNGLFSEYGVDLVLNGHDHVYARTYPIGADGLPVKDCEGRDCEIDGAYAREIINPRGTIHFESGCAGNQNRIIEPDLTPEMADCFEEMSSMTPSAVAYSVITADDSTLTLIYRENSVITGECVKHHAFRIRKGKVK